MVFSITLLTYPILPYRAPCKISLRKMMISKMRKNLRIIINLKSY